MTACKVCQHPDLDRIDIALSTGATARAVAAEYNLSNSSVNRHRSSHLPSRLLVDHSSRNLAGSNALALELRAIHSHLLEALRRAQAHGPIDLRLLVPAARELRQNVELLARLQACLPATQEDGGDESSRQLQHLMSQLPQLLAPWPDAAQRVSEALLAVAVGPEE